MTRDISYNRKKQIAFMDQIQIVVHSASEDGRPTTCRSNRRRVRKEKGLTAQLGNPLHHFGSKNVLLCSGFLHPANLLFSTAITRSGTKMVLVLNDLRNRPYFQF